MNHPDYYQTMAQYNQWMNQKIYHLCATLPDETRKADLGAFFKSIHRTLNHLLYGDRAWLGRFTNHPFYVIDLGQFMYEDFAVLKQEREKCDREILDWTKTLTPQWLSQPFTYTSNVYQETRILPTWLLVTHLFNHQTHHRGQITTLLSQLGFDPGITDLPWMPDTNKSNENATLNSL